MTKEKIENLDSFIRSDYYAGWKESNETSSVVSNRSRYDRMCDYAENGANGSTYGEVIEDQREAFSDYSQDELDWEKDEGLINSINKKIDDLEEWFQERGRLDEVIN